MTIAMAGLNYESCFVYLDDLIIFGNNLVNHNKNLVKVLTRLREVNLKLNPNKCKFLRKKILYLGHVISSAGISPDPEKIRTIQKYPTPQNAGDTNSGVKEGFHFRKIPNRVDFVLKCSLSMLERRGKKSTAKICVLIFLFNN